MAVALCQFLTFGAAVVGAILGVPCIALAAAVDHTLGVRLLALVLSACALPLLGLSLVWALRAIAGNRAIRAWRRGGAGPFCPDPSSQPRDLDLALAIVPWALFSVLIWAIVL